MTTYTHITTVERKEIAYLHNEKGYSLRHIAQILERNVSSISREIQRNRTISSSTTITSHSTSRAKTYHARWAKHKAYVRRKYSKYQWMKIQNNDRLKTYVIERLQKNWTPEMISGRLRYEESSSNIGKDRRNIHPWYISSKSIYQWLYTSWWQQYCTYLCSSRYNKRRRYTHGRQGKNKRQMIPQRVGIEERPSVANTREEVWHWEADTIVSGRKTGGKMALCTLVDRKTRYTCIRRMPNLRPDSMNTGILHALHRLPCTTITYDNGIENKRHITIASRLSCMTYFCDPYSSWQKWTNENTNGRIRRFIPKGCDISFYSTGEVQKVEDWLNHTPRKCLHYKTPFECMQEEIQWREEEREEKNKKKETLHKKTENTSLSYTLSPGM